MKLFKLSQTENNGYDTYDSCVVAAENAEDAKLIHPSEHASESWVTERFDTGAWAKPDQISVEEIGTAAPHIKPGVILASFNAG